MKKLFSELRIVGWSWNGKHYLSSWYGDTERWEVRNVDPTYIKHMFSSVERKVYDNVAEIVPFEGNDYKDKLVVIAFVNEPNGEVNARIENSKD